MGWVRTFQVAGTARVKCQAGQSAQLAGVPHSQGGAGHQGSLKVLGGLSKEPGLFSKCSDTGALKSIFGRGRPLWMLSSGCPLAAARGWRKRGRGWM